MDPVNLSENARIVDAEGRELGALQAIEETERGLLLLARDADGREVQIPWSEVDTEHSTAERVVVPLESGEWGTVPLAAEEMDVSTRWTRKGTVRVHKRVETVPQEKEVELTQEGVDVERVPIDEIVDTPPQTRTEGETMIIPVVEEVLVIEKRYRVVEEVRVATTRRTERQTVREDLRREVVEFEEVHGDDEAAGAEGEDVAR